MTSHIPLVVEGVLVGDLIAAGDELVFFTIEKALVALDGVTFGSTAELVAAVIALSGNANVREATPAASLN